MHAIRLLIDGYNLLFQSPLTGAGRAAGWLERARERLLAYLNQRLPADMLPGTTIVFDAPKTGPLPEDFVFDRGIQVRFAGGYPEADDLLEELIRHSPHPKQLRVVSSDQRVRRCAKARRATSIDVDSFLRELELSRQPMLPHVYPDAADRGAEAEPRLSEEEVSYWIEKFKPN